MEIVHAHSKYKYEEVEIAKRLSAFIPDDWVIKFIWDQIGFNGDISWHADKREKTVKIMYYNYAAHTGRMIQYLPDLVNEVKEALQEWEVVPR